jgi:hypothetical protein
MSDELKPKNKEQWVKCERCSCLIQRKQGEERVCVQCEIDLADGDAINDCLLD